MTRKTTRSYFQEGQLTVEAMTSSQKIYKQLCNFRAGIESNISELKRASGLKRSLWRGLKGFMADIWSSIVSYNLVRIARPSETKRVGSEVAVAAQTLGKEKQMIVNLVDGITEFEKRLFMDGH